MKNLNDIMNIYYVYSNIRSGEYKLMLNVPICFSYIINESLPESSMYFNILCILLILKKSILKLL